VEIRWPFAREGKIVVMGTVAAKLTTEEFLALPESPGVKRELIEGEVFEVGTGGPVHERLKANFIWRLGLYFGSRKQLALFPETMYHFTGAGSLQPDVSVVLSGNLDPSRSGRITIAPDLAIEVVSSESASDLNRKVHIYLAHGVRSVWVAYPESRTVMVHKKGSVAEFECGQTLAEPDLLPGFSIPVDDLFEGI
jgi:Uma2 family endonuclease